MNGKERVLATISGAASDRRPFAAVLSLYGAQLTGRPVSDHYSDPDAYAEGQQAVWETIQPDILFGPFCLPVLGEAFGSQLKYLDEQAPNLKTPAARTPAEVAALPVPDVDSHPRLLYLRKAVRRMADRFGDEAIIAQPVLSPMDLPVMIMGLEEWLNILLFDPEGLRRVLAVTTDFCQQWAEALLADGATCLVYALACINPAIVTREVAAEKALPVYREAFRRVPGPVVVHHTGAPFLSFVDLFRDAPGNMVGLCVHHTDGLREARERAGEACVLFGGLDGSCLDSMSVEEVEKQCADLLTDRADDPRYILSTSSADVPLATPEENILCLREAVEREANGR